MSTDTDVYIVIRHDYSHHTDNVGREHIKGAYSSLAAANAKAKRLFRRAIREENYNNIAQIEDEDDYRGQCYVGRGRLCQDETEEGIDRFEVRVELHDLQAEASQGESGDEEDDEDSDQDDDSEEDGDESEGDEDNDDSDKGQDEQNYTRATKRRKL